FQQMLSQRLGQRTEAPVFQQLDQGAQRSFIPSEAARLFKRECLAAAKPAKASAVQCRGRNAKHSAPGAFRALECTDGLEAIAAHGHARKTLNLSFTDFALRGKKETKQTAGKLAC